jgi:SAM-dependent methyltransferase
LQEMSILREYYQRRAPEYEQVYYRDDRVRQGELETIAAAMSQALAGRRVLEIACGTGYWTERLAPVARHIVATDVAPGMLALAQAKGLAPDRVDFLHGDAYALDRVPGMFDAALAMFWFSHVPRGRIAAFLDGLNARLGPGAVVFLGDNAYLPGVGGDLVTTPGSEDTFKLRHLQDGSRYEVLKNYYDRRQLREIFAPRARGLDVRVGTCYWWVTYRVRG